MAANMAREIRDLVLNQTAMMESLVNRVGDLEDMVSTGSVSTVSDTSSEASLDDVSKGFKRMQLHELVTSAPSSLRNQVCGNPFDELFEVPCGRLPGQDFDPFDEFSVTSTDTNRDYRPLKVMQTNVPEKGHVDLLDFTGLSDVPLDLMDFSDFPVMHPDVSTVQLPQTVVTRACTKGVEQDPGAATPVVDEPMREVDEEVMKLAVESKAVTAATKAAGEVKPAK